MKHLIVTDLSGGSVIQCYCARLEVSAAAPRHYKSTMPSIAYLHVLSSTETMSSLRTEAWLCFLRRHELRGGIMLYVACLCLTAVSGLALDPHSPASTFIRTDFTVEGGLPSNVVNAIAQTRNGFLWIGTDSGLARFNGRQFLPINFRQPPLASQNSVRALAEDSNGDLWEVPELVLCGLRVPL